MARGILGCLLLQILVELIEDIWEGSTQGVEPEICASIHRHSRECFSENWRNSRWMVQQYQRRFAVTFRPDIVIRDDVGKLPLFFPDWKALDCLSIFEHTRNHFTTDIKERCKITLSSVNPSTSAWMTHLALSTNASSLVPSIYKIFHSAEFLEFTSRTHGPSRGDTLPPTLGG